MDGDVRTFTADPHDEPSLHGHRSDSLVSGRGYGKDLEPLDGMLANSDEAKKKWDVPPRLARRRVSPRAAYLYSSRYQNLIFVLLGAWRRPIE